MALKVRENPFSVALKFNSPYRGRQVIYVEGENDGKMLVKPEGFKAIVGTLSIDPHGDQALAENRHPITQAGLSSMVRLVLSQWKSELKQEDLHDVEISEDKSTGQTCRKIQVVRSSQTPGIPFHMTCLYLSQETKLPVRIENYDWPSTPGKKTGVGRAVHLSGCENQRRPQRRRLSVTILDSLPLDAFCHFDSAK
jgi:hypothetical protein